MAKNTSKRRIRYGTVSLLLCVLVLISLVIINVIAAVLSLRYEWMYQEIARPEVYKVSDTAREYIDAKVAPIVDEQGGNIRIIFCDTKDSIRSNDQNRAS